VELDAYYSDYSKNVYNYATSPVINFLIDSSWNNQTLKTNQKILIDNSPKLFKGTNNVAGLLIDLGVTENSQEIIFNLVYNATQEGSVRRHLIISGQIYGGYGNKAGMIQNGNIPVDVYYFLGTENGIGDTHSYLWIPTPNKAYFPSVIAEVWVSSLNNIKSTQRIGVIISTLSVAPDEILIPISLYDNFTVGRITSLVGTDFIVPDTGITNSSEIYARNGVATGIIRTMMNQDFSYTDGSHYFNVGHLSDAAMEFKPKYNVTQLWEQLDPSAPYNYFAVNTEGVVYMWRCTNFSTGLQMSAQFTWLY
jgi:hypothetical protein